MTLDALVCTWIIGASVASLFVLGLTVRFAVKLKGTTMPIDQPPAIVQQVNPGKTFSVHLAHNGWWAHIEGHAYPFGAWRMDRGPYPFKWMAELEFPIERMTKDGPRR